jgi:hypothetical protein
MISLKNVGAVHGPGFKRRIQLAETSDFVAFMYFDVGTYSNISKKLKYICRGVVGFWFLFLNPSAERRFSLTGGIG